MNLSFTSSKSQLAALPIPTHITLASQSVGRRQILDKMSIRFRVAVTNVEEDRITNADPIKTIKMRAAAKLDEVINHRKVYMIDEKVKNLIIAADSMAVIGKKSFGKPDGREGVKTMLKELMGKTHVFTTALSAGFLDVGGIVKKRWDKTESTKVTMRKMAAAELESYANRFDFSRFAAAYALNDAPWDLVTKIDGSYTNVVGLPAEIILPILRSLELIT